jgi:DNA-binding transcriptional MerR regulator
MLSPQKNRSGQRSYRRRDVEIALRIKQLLYEEMFTIAGAKKKLQTDMREASKLKIVHPDPAPAASREYTQPVSNSAPGLFDSEFDMPDEIDEIEPAPAAHFDSNQRAAIKSLASQLLELREMLRNKSV